MKPFSPFSACLFCGEPVENFEPGPRGGASQNMTCMGCGARYNLAIVEPGQYRIVDSPLFLEVLEGPKNTVPLSDRAARLFEDHLGIKDWPGYAGRFSRDEADGALPNGTRIAKTNSEQGDRYADGTLGTILGSIKHDGVIMYFVEWDAWPKAGVGIVESRVRRA